MPFDGNPGKNTALSQVVLDLIAARDYLDEHGWCSGNLIQGERRCLIGAIYQVTDSFNKRPLNHPNAQRAVVAIKVLEAQIRETTRHPNVYTFNDQPHRTYRQIHDILDLTIKNEMAKA